MTVALQINKDAPPHLDPCSRSRFSIHPTSPGAQERSQGEPQETDERARKGDPREPSNPLCVPTSLNQRQRPGTRGKPPPPPLSVSVSVRPAVVRIVHRAPTPTNKKNGQPRQKTTQNQRTIVRRIFLPQVALALALVRLGDPAASLLDRHPTSLRKDGQSTLRDTRPPKSPSGFQLSRNLTPTALSRSVMRLLHTTASPSAAPAFLSHPSTSCEFSCESRSVNQCCALDSFPGLSSPLGWILSCHVSSRGGAALDLDCPLPPPSQVPNP